MPFWKHAVHAIAYGFGAGLAPIAPGTFGTLPALPLYWAMAGLRAVYYWGLTALLGIAGVFICETTATDLGAHDPGVIVYDEIVGYLFAMFRLPRDWRWLLAGFVVYRLFDVWKPYPIGAIEEGFGVGASIMADDMVAGVYAWCVLHLVRRAMQR